MLFDCLQENLNKGLSAVNRFIPSRPALSILANILITAKNGELRLGATNLESGISLDVGAKIEQEGEIVVPGKTITELISSLPAGKIEFALEDGSLKIKSLASKAAVACLPGNEFPPFPKSAGPDGLKFAKEEIIKPVLQTAFCAATDESRPVLSGLKIFIKDGKLNFVATDGYRLSLKTMAAKSGTNLSKGIILPSRTILEVIKILESDEKGEVGFEMSPNQAIFKLSRAEVFCRLIEGQYPDFEKIIPGSFTTKAVFSREALSAAVKTTAIFARESANIVKFQITNSKLQISANAAQVGSSVSEIEANIEGEGGEIAFNVRFLQDLLNIVDSEELLFEMTNSLSPGVFKIPGDPSFLHLIMPVRVTE